MPKDAKIGDLTVSRSQILDYLNCGYRWDLSYRRGIQTAHVREALDQGSAVHRGIKGAIAAFVTSNTKVEAAMRQGALTGIKDWAKEARTERGKFLTDEARDQIKEIERNSFGIAQKALEHFNLAEWEVAMWKGKPLFEVEVVTPLPPWKGYRCIPDLVARPRREGKKAPYWLIDWKGRASFEEDDAEEVNLQFASMQHVLEIEIPKLQIEGSILWQVKSQAPRWPSQNKDGTMSRAAIVTDWLTYEAALKKANLDPAEYEDMKAKIAEIEWFRAIKQHRTPEECERVWFEIVHPAALRMAKDPQVIRRWTHMPFACKGCWARAFCLAELRGEDTEFMLETDYMDTRAPRKRRDLGENIKKFQLT